MPVIGHCICNDCRDLRELDNFKQHQPQYVVVDLGYLYVYLVMEFYVKNAYLCGYISSRVVDSHVVTTLYPYPRGRRTRGHPTLSIESHIHVIFS